MVSLSIFITLSLNCQFQPFKFYSFAYLQFFGSFLFDTKMSCIIIFTYDIFVYFFLFMQNVIQPKYLCVLVALYLNCFFLVVVVAEKIPWMYPHITEKASEVKHHCNQVLVRIISSVFDSIAFMITSTGSQYSRIKALMLYS